MIITSALPSNFANAVAPFSPIGSSGVGEENLEAKNTPMKPVEASAESGKLQNDNRQSSAIDSDIDDASVEGETPGQSADDSEDKSSARQALIDEQEQLEIAELAARDREVRAHEQAHASVGGVYAGAPVLQFERGPDGVSYAVAGEVSISTSEVAGDPQATIDKAQQIRRAALAPADPSPQDRQVAALAAQMEMEARQELRLQSAEAEDADSESDTENASDASGEADTRAGLEASPVGEPSDNTQNIASSQPTISSLDLNKRLASIGLNSHPSGSLIDQRA